MLKLRVKTHYASPLTSHTRQREEYALTNPQAWKSVAIVGRKTLVGYKVRWVYEAHLGVALEPWRPVERYKEAISDRRVGLDLGVSSLGIVTVDTTGVMSAELIRAGVEDKVKRKDARLIARRRARALERSRRANNPDAYHKGKTGKLSRGSRKAGVRLVASNNYMKLLTAQADTARALAQDRKRQINTLANHIISEHGINIVTENITVSSWTRLWGGSVGEEAPATLMRTIQREAKRAGGTWTEVNTYTTALSQHCICGKRTPKLLKQRVHECLGCEHVTRPVHRDLLAAFNTLAVVQVQNSTGNLVDVFDPTLAQALWAGREGAGECLQAAGKNANSITWNNLMLDDQCEQVAVELTSSSYLDNVVTILDGEGIWIDDKLTSRNLVPTGNLIKAQTLTEHRH